MESYAEKLRGRLNDEAFEYRRDAFLAFLKAPVRNYKESPTVKEYVEISDADLEAMVNGQVTETDINDTATDVLVLNHELARSNISGQIRIRKLSTVISEDPALASKYVYSFLGKERQEYLINSAWMDGIAIEIPDRFSGSLKISNYAHSSSSFCYKSIIIVGKECNIDLTDLYFSTGEGSGIQGKTIYLYVGENSKVRYHYLQDKGQGVTDITFVRQFMERFSEFTFFHINHGSDRVLFVDESQQKGDLSSFRVFGVNFSDRKQKMDIRDSSFQIGESTTADIQVRGVVLGSSSTVHRGNIDLEDSALKSSGFYDSKILLLSKDGYANSKPALMIKNANTRSKHGSSISDVDEDQIFYLRSRGIPTGMAKSMITAGFVGSMTERSNDEYFRNKVYEYAKGIELNDLS
ncbi:MAG: SufD family Fe-S cluster assembly protein [Thermoplasmataceae archaeon]